MWHMHIHENTQKVFNLTHLDSIIENLTLFLICHLSLEKGRKKNLGHLDRSTRFNLANRKLVVESFSHLLSIMHVKTLCERLLSLFIFVAATFLFKVPYAQNEQ